MPLLPFDRFENVCSSNLEAEQDLKQELEEVLQGVEEDAKFERCVRHLMAKGYDKDAAYAICRTTVGFTRDDPARKKRRKRKKKSK